VLAEVEPFKTTFLVGIGTAAWPYGLFVAVLLGLSIFIERPYCKYLCPLGAALAMPSTFRWFGLQAQAGLQQLQGLRRGLRLAGHRRRWPHRPPRVPALPGLHGALHRPKGCPPLAKERKRRERDGLALTPIGDDGYYIPIQPVGQPGLTRCTPRPPRARPAHAHRAGEPPTSGGGGSWPGWLETARPPVALEPRRLAFASARCRSPASVAGDGRHRGLGAGRRGQAVVGAIIGWWFGWSVYEVLIRLSGKRYVKDGPWWQDHYRVAGVMDMLSYVGFKNLLIGAACSWH
jgi:NosR/NirI family nitrous oxide reductase transcriptional regulator